MTRRTLATLVAVVALVGGSAGVSQAADGGQADSGFCHGKVYCYYPA